MSEKPTYEELEKRNRELEKRLRIDYPAEKHHLKILDCSPSVIYTKDLEGRYTSINKPFEKLSGLKSKDVIGKTDFELFPSLVAENSTKNDKLVIQTGIPKEIEEYGPVDGKMHTFFSTKYPLMDDEGKIYGICGVSTDITKYRETEEILRENELKIESLINNLPGTTYKFIMDTEGSFRFEYISNNCINLFGIKADKILSDANSVFDLIPQPDADMVLKTIKKSAETLTPYDVEHRVIKKDGETVWIHAVSTPRKHQNGNIVWDGVGLDITENKKNEIIIEKKNTDLRLAQRIASIGNWTLDPKIGVPEWTDEIYRIYERDPELGPHPLSDYKTLYKGKYWEIFNTSIQGAIKDGIPYDIELKVELPSGNIKWVNAICEIDPESGPEGRKLRGTIQDITKRKKAEAKIKESEEKLRQAQALGKIGSWEFDVQSQRFTWSEEVFRLFERDPSEGPPNFDETMAFYHPEYAKRFQRQIQAAIEKGATVEDDYQLKLPSGRSVWHHGKIFIKNDENGNTSKLLGTLQDITDRKTLEKSLSIEKKRLSMLLEAFPGFIYLQASDYSVPFANQYFIEKFGNPRHRPCYKVLWNRETPCEPCHTFKVFETNMPQKWEWTDSPDGRVYMIHDFPFIDTNGSFMVLEIGIDISDQKKAEEALKRSEERYKLAMDFANDGLFDWNLETSEIYYSPVWKRLLGYDDDELPNHFSVWENLTKPEDVKRSWEMQNELIHKRRDRFEIEFKMKHKNGHWIDILSRANAIFDENDKAVRIVGTHIDITEKKKTEDHLKKSKLIIESTSDAIISTDVSGIITSWNPGAERLYGYSSMEVLNKSINLIYKDEDLPVLENLITNLIEGKDLSNEEVTCIDKDGNDVDILLSLMSIKEENDKIVELVGFTKDITERKKYEKEITLQKEKAERYLNLAGVIFVAINAEGIVTLINQKGCDILGYPKEEIIGRNWFENFIPEWLRDDLIPVSKQLFNGDIEAVEYFENPILSKNGEERLIAWHNTILKDEKGIITGHLSSGEDITEKKQMEKQLQQAQKMESIGRLAGGVAHDSNNMLSIILGNTELAFEELEQGLSVHDRLKEIQSAAQRSVDITRQLLAFARRQTIAPKVLDLNKTLENILKMLRRLIGEDIDLVWLPGDNLWPVKIDPSQVDQILANLSVNARDAISGVGKLTIETDNVTLDDVYIAKHPGFTAGHYVMLAVSDTGMGMEKEILDNIFEPFYTTKEHGKGTGLGLATVYGVVKQNNGFIDVYSEPGYGTTFKIYFPPYRAKAEITPGEVKIHPDQHGHETILLVEDEPAILRMTALMLERLGYAVVAAKTPGEAIQYAQGYTGTIDLLVTDVVMPEMNGRDLAKNLLSFYPDLKRLFMSGYTADVIAHHGVLDEGVNFIQKPFSKEQLGTKVRETLDGKEV